LKNVLVNGIIKMEVNQVFKSILKKLWKSIVYNEFHRVSSTQKLSLIYKNINNIIELFFFITQYILQYNY